MATTSARALRLLSLLSGGRTLTGDELARELGASVRTVRRDVDTLRGLGYDIEPVHGTGGGYRVRGRSGLPPLTLDEDGVMAVVVALQTVPAVLDGIADSAARALAAVREVVPHRLRSDADAFAVTVLANQWEFPAPSIPAAVVREVGVAARLGQVVRIRARAGDRPSSRVEPHEVVVWAGRWYLVGYDLDDDGWCVLRLDAVDTVTPTGQPFATRELPGGSVEAFVKDTPDRGDSPAPWPCVGSARVAVPAAVVARFAPGGAVVDALVDAGDGDGCRLTMGAWSWVGLAGLFLTFAADLTDVEPAALRAAFAQVHARTGRIQ